MREAQVFKNVLVRHCIQTILCHYYWLECRQLEWDLILNKNPIISIIIKTQNAIWKATGRKNEYSLMRFTEQFIDFT